MSAERDREPLSTVLSQVSVPAGAVFLSYASEDADAAERIATALRSAGIQAWLDKSELRGGDAWDRQIRQQIHECRLFIAVISAHTEARDEGYFRREWKLAVDRTHDMAEKKAFIVPVVVDGTSERGASVPDKFREVQWTRLPGGGTSDAFVERVRRLVSPDGSPTRAAAARSGSTPLLRSAPSVREPSISKPALRAASAILAVALGYFVVDKFWISKESESTSPPARTLAGQALQRPSAASAKEAIFNPPPHSIAVLPFVNMSGDKDQEYFSEGLTEELLNSLSHVSELQVAARTSSFSFQGEHPDIATVAQKLNVGVVLEGSVRRSANTVRITTQLVNGATGFHLWSETYDRDLGDVLKLQTEIATAVASALKVTLLSDEAAKIEVGGTRNPAAFDAYLRATKAYWDGFSNVKGNEAAVAGFTDAIRLDPDYALAYSGRSFAFTHNAGLATTLAAMRAGVRKAQADSRQAISLAPDLGEAHAALGLVYRQLLEFSRANEEYERALALAPGSARVLWNYGIFAALMGRNDFGLKLLRRALVLDPLNSQAHDLLGTALLYRHRHPEAIAAYKDAEALDPSTPNSESGSIGYAFYLLGDFENARTSCEKRSELNLLCLALTYEKLGRHADAEAMLAKARASYGDTSPAAYAAVYAQWGDTATALEWLETAIRVRDPGLEGVKTEPFLDPLRNEPRFQAIERALKFPTD